MKRYFAYGSNMDENDLNRWCDNKGYTRIVSKEKIPAKLPGYSIVFNYFSTKRKCGVANIMKKNGENVFGLLMEITDEDLGKISEKEGPDCYKQIEVGIYDLDGKNIGEAVTYKVLKDKEESCHQPPTQEYLNLIISNIKKYGFPRSYIEGLNNIETVE